MAYIHLDFKSAEPRTLKKVLSHIDCMLEDVYTLFGLDPERQDGLAYLGDPAQANGVIQAPD